jgi:hypothetical protein
MTSKTIYLFVFFSFLIVFSPISYAQDGTTWLEFSTLDHPRATGQNFILHHPSSYEKYSDFNKEEYLQIFVESNEEGSGDRTYWLTVGIKNLPNNLLASSLGRPGVWFNDELDKLWKTIAKEIPYLKFMQHTITWYNIPMARFSTGEIRDGFTIITAILFALHGDKLIKLECGYTVIDVYPEETDQDYTTNPTCQSYFNSLQFIDYSLD